MRKLTIRRAKSFVACLAKMKIYIEDPEAGDLTINGVMCRKLGEIKNGEEKTFSIGFDAARVFAIGDKLSRSYSNDCYPVPAGQEDVVLSGKNVYAPASGNPFRFDGVTDEVILANRKKRSRVGVVVLVVAGILGAIAGFFAGRSAVNKDPEPKDFSVDGMTITLLDSFQAFDSDFTASYATADTIVMILKEPFALAQGFRDLTLEEYAALVIQNNSPANGAELRTQDSLVIFEYLYNVPDYAEPFYYFSTVYKSGDAFWLVQFSTPESMADTYQPQFIQWANSVTFE